MTDKDKIQICASCKNHKMNMAEGLVCGLTGCKPSFEESCESYVEDSALLERKQMAEAECGNEYAPVMEGDEVSKNEVINGSSWLLTIGLLSALNILLYYVDVAFIFSLGTTQISQVQLELGVGESMLNIITLIALPALFIWAWYQSSKNGDRIAFLIAVLAYLLDGLVMLWMYDLTSDDALIIDLCIHGGLLLYLFICLFLPSKGKHSPSALSRIAFIVFSAITIAISAISFNNLKTYVESPIDYSYYDFDEYGYDYDYDYSDDDYYYY